MTDTCAWCDAPKTSDIVCPRCGANYAKAEAIKKHGNAKAVVDAAPAPEIRLDSSPDDGGTDYAALVKDPAAEWNNCLYALPAMLLGAWACQHWNIFDGLQRITFGMPVHEFGHALTAWLAGYNAIPTFWFTHTSAERGVLGPLVMLGLYAVLIRVGITTRQRWWYALISALAMLQLYLTYGLNAATAEMLIIFGGDAMGMVIATCMMGTFYLGKDTQLYKGSVRWGLVFWGAAAFMDFFMAWWEGQSDIARVGYGTTGGAYTDAYLLINAYAWNWDEMIDRHLLVGYLCLLTLAAIYALGLWQAYGWLQQHSRAETIARIRARR